MPTHTENNKLPQGHRERRDANGYLSFYTKKQERMRPNDKKEPILVIMAAGMGSRFGGLKQIQPVDQEGHIIIDFSLFDAWRAGFRRLVFIIKKEHEELFRRTVGDRMEQWFEVNYVFQELARLPEGYRVPEGREKPWGNRPCHSLLSGSGGCSFCGD